MTAMEETGVRRLVCVTGAMIGEYPANRSPAFRLFAALLARRFGEVFADRRRQEEIVRASGLDWTLLKPPRLTDGPRTDRVRLEVDLRVGMFSRLSRADLTVAILNELEQRRFLHQAVFLRSV